ncbi:hypothetical protein RKD46_007628 [Streptomyces pseudovenezuelae]
MPARTDADGASRGKCENSGTSHDHGSGRLDRPARRIRNRPGTPGPRSGRHHAGEDARRSAHGADHRRRHRGRLPARRRRRRREETTRRPHRTGARGVRLVQPHLRQRHPRPVAAVAAVHGGQPRPLDASHGTRPQTDRASPRPAGTARRPDPDRPAGRRRLRGRPGPRGLAVRGHARVRRVAHLARLPVARRVGRRLVEQAGPPPRPGRPGPGRADRPALVPVPPHLERLRVPAAHVPPRRARGGPRPHRARPARLLVRPPAGRPPSGRAHRRGPADDRRRGQLHGGPPRPRPGRPRPPRHARPAPAGRSRRLRGRRRLGGVPPRPQREVPRPAARRASGTAPPARRAAPARPRRGVRRVGAAGVAVARPAVRGRHLRRHRLRAGPPGRRPGPGRPPAVPHASRPARRDARPGRTRRRDAGLRPGRRDVRRRLAARGGLAGRHRCHHPRPAGPPDLAGIRDPAGPPRGAGPLRLARPPHLALRPGPTGHRRERVPRGAQGRGTHPPASPAPARWRRSRTGDPACSA